MYMYCSLKATQAKLYIGTDLTLDLKSETNVKLKRFKEGKKKPLQPTLKTADHQYNLLYHRMKTPFQ